MPKIKPIEKLAAEVKEGDIVRMFSKGSGEVLGYFRQVVPDKCLVFTNMIPENELDYSAAIPGHRKEGYSYYYLESDTLFLNGSENIRDAIQVDSYKIVGTAKKR
jgi:hypothetical protein